MPGCVLPLASCPTWTAGMRIVGQQDRTELEPDPEKAWSRGVKLDAMLKGTLPPHPKGVFRGSHAFFNRMDDDRARQIAARVNPALRR